MVTYEPGFKEQAVKMAAEIGSAKTAQDLGILVYEIIRTKKRTNAC